MEADVLTLVQAVRRAGEDVFAGMVLHPAQPLFPVKLSGHLGAGFKRAVAVVENRPVLFVHVGYRNRPKDTGIRRLSAALREEGCFIQNHFPAVFVLRAAQHGCRKLKLVAVDIIESCCHVSSRII